MIRSGLCPAVRVKKRVMLLSHNHDDLTERERWSEREAWKSEPGILTSWITGCLKDLQGLKALKAWVCQGSTPHAPTHV